MRREKFSCFRLELFLSRKTLSSPNDSTSHAPARLVPSRGREEFCLKLLAANNLFSDTMGFTLGVDEAQELVTLQLAWDISRLDAEGFARIVNNLLAVAADWMLRLDQWRPSADGGGDEPAASSEDMPFVNFLQV